MFFILSIGSLHTFHFITNMTSSAFLKAFVLIVEVYFYNFILRSSYKAIVSTKNVMIIEVFLRGTIPPMSNAERLNRSQNQRQKLSQKLAYCL